MNFYQQPFGFGQQPFIVGQPVIQQPQFMGQPEMFMGQLMSPISGIPGGATRDEQSYIENILRLNLGKVVTIYMNFENSQWGSKIFKGYLMAAGKDHIIVKDLNSETRYLLLMVYLDYITFEEELEYQYPFRKAKKDS